MLRWALAREGAEDGETSRTLLLRDLRALFAAEPRGVLLTAEILRELHARDDRPWPEYRGGRPITARQMAALLRPVGISAGTVRRGGQTAKGYRAEDMADAWSRYLPGRASVTLSHPAESPRPRTAMLQQRRGVKCMHRRRFRISLFPRPKGNAHRIWSAR